MVYQVLTNFTFKEIVNLVGMFNVYCLDPDSFFHCGSSEMDSKRLLLMLL